VAPSSDKFNNSVFLWQNQARPLRWNGHLYKIPTQQHVIKLLIIISYHYKTTLLSLYLF